MYWIQELERMREEQRRNQFQQPVLHLPLPAPPPGYEMPEMPPIEEDTVHRGVVVFDIFPTEEE